MKELSAEELLKWNEEDSDSLFLVIIKTKVCPRCIRFIDHIEGSFGSGIDDEAIAVFVQENTKGYEMSGRMLSDLGVMNVPVVLYKEDRTTKIKSTDDLSSFDRWMEDFLENKGGIR